MSWWAKPGAQCVCVKAIKSSDLRGITRLPVLGETLTVREVYAGRTESGVKVVGLRFCEIVNPVVDTAEGLTERGYQVSWFRPLVPQSDDVALFAHHLLGQTTGADA